MLRLAMSLLVLSALPARADEVDDLVARGEALAKQSEFTQAIRAFKQADAKRPRAAHACMIGLAYMRREAWPQAELFLALCEKRAVPGDQPPDWIDAAHRQLATKLRDAQIPAITIQVTPANVGARLTVSSFEPDELFEPQTIHLAPGKHVIEVAAPGHRRMSREVVVERGVPQTVSFTLEPDPTAPDDVPPTVAAPQPLTPPTRTVERPAASSSNVPWIVLGAGAALVGIGLVYDLTYLQPARERLDQAESVDAYRALEPDFRTRQRVTVGLVAGGLVVAGVGVALKLTVFKTGPQVSAAIDPTGATVFMGWQR
jgi:hypothetical protein